LIPAKRGAEARTFDTDPTRAEVVKNKWF